MAAETRRITGPLSTLLRSILTGGRVCLLLFWFLRTTMGLVGGGGINVLRVEILLCVGVGSAMVGLFQVGIATRPARAAVLLNPFVWAFSMQQIVAQSGGLEVNPLGIYGALANPYTLLQSFLTLQGPVLLPAMFSATIALSVGCHWFAIQWQKRNTEWVEITVN